MTTNLAQLADADRHFQATLNISLDTLLAPIKAAMPCGRPARDSPSYSQIAQERRHDDPSLPMGAWQRDLKRADWLKVSQLITEMLMYESKDIQLLAWLYEAQLKQYGIAGIAPTLVLLCEMISRYWDHIHPSPSQGDYEHRANLIRSISDKNLAALRLAPLIQLEDGKTYCWADWERAHYHERARGGSRSDVDTESATLAQLQEALDATSAADFLELRARLSDALNRIDEMNTVLDQRFEGEAPSLHKTTELLGSIRSLVDGELHKQGVPLKPPAVHEPLAAGVGLDSAETYTAPPPPVSGTPETLAVATAVRDRADAYARLKEIAEFLIRLEPHSPVPYLVLRATLWGRMNTTELYQEVFMRLGGQLNIFEMVGIESAQPSNPS
ncbi:type VI secretion protein [Robbsia andropogonis]|uniref:Type VI secretion protein n=1 Tax=Robbsia andropogonis TaxID=28092 RepID=A0A0F5JTR7_9BURK|nr:type VI secretion system protein TssA [Robbsia andropogonis]KKB61228.1 type VI secretion protein [Robbsia andropogonis]MCP1121190.1 type VI secretion system protein TssA [Robbsia andropogonis]MCP1130982.1 type VI secretion system protein TssA [Robbsia andropogonis]